MNNSAGVIDLSKYEQTKPFMSEYAKSSLSFCKTCNNNIIQGELRLVRSQSHGSRTRAIDTFFFFTLGKQMGIWQDHESVSSLELHFSTYFNSSKISFGNTKL